uniref:Anoctamin n=1 Tax=Esox lucius TaxID=8010 RepID=A0A6Q2XCN1_ESOLU
MERLDDDYPMQTINNNDKGSGKTFLVHNRSGSLLAELEGQGVMKRNDHYIPVPGEEKATDFGNTKDGCDGKHNQCDFILLGSLSSDEAAPGQKQGPTFKDGRRRVDYVLTYHIQKPQSVRRNTSRFSGSRVLRSLRQTLSLSKSPAMPPPKIDPEIAAQEHRLDYHEDDKRFRQNEFEDNLREMGLELEKDEGNKIPGIGFVKIHAPWNVLCREAEFMKLKMPTRKVYEVKQGSNLVEKINLFIHKVTEPLHPKVESNKPQNIAWEGFDNISLLSPQLLYEEWASYSVFYKYQPIGLIRKYFGDKIGLYFAWLGIYTQMLIPAAIVGVIVFLYGCATVDDNIPSMEICDPRNNITMCPMCDRACSYWKLREACGTARASHLFDNPATVFFSIFMALWAAMFMEHWKRRQMRLNYIWDLTGFEEEEDHRRAEYELRVMKKTLKKQHKSTQRLPLNKKYQSKRDTALPYCNSLTPHTSSHLYKSHRQRLRRLLTPLQVSVTFAIVFGVILYRISIRAALHMSSNPSNIRATVKGTAAVINLIVIIIMDEVYGALARWLTLLEIPKTDKSFEERLIFKTFVLKFVNAFTPIVYLAFFRGRLDLFYFPDDLFTTKRDTCAHAGCLMELCIQLCITMLGKQLIQNNLFEIIIPKIKKLIRRRKSDMDSQQQEDYNLTLQRYEKDHFLGPFEGLSPEYMEMIIQFGMVTLFVASFPLAPLFALLNNIIEIRLDAKKFVTELRRPIAARAKDIGIWYNLLRGLSKVAVIVNAFVISFTSDFIPRLVYQYMYSSDGSMHGFVNHTLSYFNVTEFQPGTAPLQPLHLGYEVELCRYKDYREPPWSNTPYDLSKEFWAILACRLAFVIVFQNVVMLMSDFVDWLIPDIPKDISMQIHKEKILMVELFMKEEKGKKRLRENHSNQSPVQPRCRPSSQETSNC